MKLSDVLLAGVGLIIVTVIVTWFVMGGGQHVETMRWRLSFQKWAKENIADPNAEIISISQPETIRGETFRLVKVRALNRMGGPIIQEMLLKRKDSGNAVVLTAADFIESFDGIKPSQKERDEIEAALRRMGATEH